MTTEKKPAEKAEPTFTLSLPVLVTIIDEIKALDARIGETLGTIGKIMGDARTATLATVPFEDESVESPTLDMSGTWAERLEALDSFHAATVASFEKAIVAEAGDVQVTHKATVEALTSERAAKFNVAQSMHTMLTQMAAMFPGIEKVTLPGKGTSTPTKSSGSGKGLESGSGVSIYKVKDDGSRYFYAKGSPLGLVALRVFDSTADALRQHLTSIGVDSTQAFEPIKVTLNEKTATIGGAAGQVATETAS